MIGVLLLLSIPLYFVLFRILRSYVSKVRVRRLYSIFFAAFLSPVIYFAVIFLWLSVLNYYPRENFDSERWKSQTELRYEMTQDIMNSNLLIGKSKAEVEALLGRAGNLKESDLWKYNVGYVPSMVSLDADFLFVRFEDGKVHEVYQQ